jgi:hypothetical protein
MVFGATEFHYTVRSSTYGKVLLAYNYINKLSSIVSEPSTTMQVQEQVVRSAGWPIEP